MTDHSHDMHLADEQARNNRYLRIMKDKVTHKHPIAVSRSALWTGTGLPVPAEPQVGPLVGRVGLQGHDPIVGGSNFYIGPWHVEDDDLTVFSWAAPVASTFYDHPGKAFTLDHPVAVRRTMHTTSHTHAIDDYSDEWLSDANGTDPFAATRKLSIPKPPAATSPRPAPQPAASPAPASITPAPVPAPGTKDRPAQPGTPLRAEAAVRAALAAPRQAGLSSLLSTLQPDQYRFVTQPADAVLAIQGHPGTGKTVIAAHRAAYLVHPERAEQGKIPRILLIGPNDAYARHVADVLKALVPHEPSPITTVGMGRFLAYLRRLTYKVSGPLDGEYYEVSIDLGDFAEAAAHELRMTGAFDTVRSQEQATALVYEALRANNAAGVQLTDDPTWIHDLKRLPRWKVAVTERRFYPLLAQCSVSAVPLPSWTFDHIIVDEAQDVRPLEWRLLKGANRSGSWTLLGDMNQRRSDWAYHSWTHVARDLDLVGEDEDFIPQTFTRGYRSTAPIIAFANQLLPRDERHVDSVQQEGPAPVVIRATDKNLTDKTMATAIDIQNRHRSGTTAIITVDGTDLHRALLKAGWTLDPRDKRLHRKDSAGIYLLTPEGARGLEFDAVLVVEPADFPPNLGRMGSLYTSLTRANRELAVIHSKPLPDELRNVRKAASRMPEPQKAANNG